MMASCRKEEPRDAIPAVLRNEIPRYELIVSIFPLKALAFHIPTPLPWPSSLSFELK
jgi:hypothetical protein